MSNDVPASLSFKERLTQAEESQRHDGTSPMDKWVEGLRSAFESESDRKPLVTRFRSA